MQQMTLTHAIFLLAVSVLKSLVMIAICGYVGWVSQTMLGWWSTPVLLMLASYSWDYLAKIFRDESTPVYLLSDAAILRRLLRHRRRGRAMAVRSSWKDSAEKWVLGQQILTIFELDLEDAEKRLREILLLGGEYANRSSWRTFRAVLMDCVLCKIEWAVLYAHEGNYQPARSFLGSKYIILDPEMWFYRKT